MNASEYSEHAFNIARDMTCRTGDDRALDVDTIVYLANAAIVARMLDMRPAQLRTLADIIEADVMRSPIGSPAADSMHNQVVALRAAANVRKRKRVPYFRAFLEA